MKQKYINFRLPQLSKFKLELKDYNDDILHFKYMGLLDLSTDKYCKQNIFWKLNLLPSVNVQVETSYLCTGVYN
jgi:hypothetical protein